MLLHRMGCDYYTWVQTVVVYRTSAGSVRTFKPVVSMDEYDRHYDYENDSRDSDFEEWIDMLEVRKKEYGKKVLFADGAWTCTQGGRSRIEHLCEKNEISVESLIEVYKILDGYRR
jgi:hypothetical protein